METVGERIRAARKAKGLKMWELGKLIGRGQTYISELERGGIKRGSQLHRIAEALGVPLVWVETGAGKTENILKALRESKDARYGPILLLGHDSGAERISDANDFATAIYRASPRTRAAVELLLLPEAERARLIEGNEPLASGVRLLEAFSEDALKHRKSA